MKLIVEELKTELKQKITTGDEPVFVQAVRPHVYRHQAPAGVIYIEIRNLSGDFVVQSSTLAASAFGTDGFYHGYFLFPIQAALAPNESYWISLKAGTGYSFSESAYIGWCKDYDLRKITPTYAPNALYQSAFDFEIWAKKQMDQGRR